MKVVQQVKTIVDIFFTKYWGKFLRYFDCLFDKKRVDESGLLAICLFHPQCVITIAWTIG
jgi:hypothetical protein